MESNIENKPPAQRLPLYMDVEFRRNYARQEEKGRLKNISITGAFLELEDADFLPNERIVLTIQVSGRKRKINASIIWKNGFGCGVKFKPFNNRDIQIVDDLMYFVESKRESRRDVLSSIFKRVS